MTRFNPRRHAYGVTVDPIVLSPCCNSRRTKLSFRSSENARARIKMMGRATIPRVRDQFATMARGDALCNAPGTFSFSALSVVERALFGELIRHLDRKINPGIKQLTWNTEYVDQYIEECFNETVNVRLDSLLSRRHVRSLYKFMQYVRCLAVKFNFKLTGGQRKRKRGREGEKSTRCPPAFEQLITDPV